MISARRRTRSSPAVRRTIPADPRPDFLDRECAGRVGRDAGLFPAAQPGVDLVCRPTAGASWRKPILAPNVGLPSLSGHASSLTRPDGINLIFMTAVSQDGWKRRPVVYAQRR